MYVVSLDDVKNENVGKKAKALSDLIKRGFSVPQGFAISSEAFYDFLQKNRLVEKVNTILEDVNIDDIDSLRAASNGIIDMIISKDITGDAKNEIGDAYEDIDISKEAKAAGGPALDIIKLGRGQTNVIVRPSTDKDFSAMHTAFAKGQTSLMNAIKTCWSLFYTPEAIFYRQKKGITDFSAGVIVQKALDPEKSGNILIGKETLIEASWGFGGSIKNGIVVPDKYLIEKRDGRLISKRPGKKNLMYTRNLLSNEIIKIDVPSDQIALDVLDDVELKTLFEMTKKIEDNSIIEWCRKKDRFYMLDSRNYTSVKETKHEGEIFFKGFGVSSGTATGRLKFVSGQDFHNVEKGDIIVVRFLSPDLIPLISKINGVVSECGGLTSNFSLVCRELGVPCVTDVDTSIFVENQMVIINGYTGEIFRG